MCNCGNRTLVDAHGQGACWQCFMELSDGKAALVRENQRLESDLFALYTQLANLGLSPRLSKESAIVVQGMQKHGTTVSSLEG